MIVKEGRAFLCTSLFEVVNAAANIFVVYKKPLMKLHENDMVIVQNEVRERGD